MIKMTTEKRNEKKLREACKKLGGIAVKLYTLSLTGLPDRMVLMPGGRVWFVELKSERGKLSAMQDFVHRFLRNLGFRVEVISTDDDLDNFFKNIKTEKMSYYTTAGDNGIYNRQGDKIAEVGDDQMRAYITSLLNEQENQTPNEDTE